MAAQYVNKAKSLACLAHRTANKGLGDTYTKLMNENAKHVLKDTSALKDMPKQYVFTHLAQYVSNCERRRSVA